METILARLRSVKDSNANRREFSRYIFHEMRNPLNTIHLGLEVMMSEVENVYSKNSISIMKQSSDLLRQTFDDVLSVFEIEDGTFSLNIIVFCFSDTIMKVVEDNLLKSEADLKYISVVTEIDPVFNSIDAIGDRSIIEFVSFQLINYAIKLSENRSRIMVVVELKRIENFAVLPERLQGLSCSCHEIMLTVFFTSECKPEDIEKLFTPFQINRPNDQQQIYGTGLQIILAKGKIALHGGSLAYESIEGQRSKFIVRVPMPCKPKPIVDSSTTHVTKKEDVKFLFPLYSLVVDGKLLE